jgi:hypothetical protein
MAEKVRWGRVGPQNQGLVVQIRRYYPVNLNHQFTMRAPRLLQIACVSGDQIGQCADHGDRVLYNLVPSVPYNCFGRKQL